MFTFDSDEVTFDSTEYEFTGYQSSVGRGGCDQGTRAPIPCPSTVEQHRRIAVALLPPGFAWNAANQPGKVMYQYWRAVARTLQWFTDQVCILTNELFCSTRSVLGDDYNREFNLPDPCSVFLDPCSVRPVERARCEDLIAAIVPLGWAAECSTITGASSSGCAVSGCDAVASGEVLTPRIVITVDTANSPAFKPTASSASGLAASGCSVAGCEASGAGTIIGLRCVIDRFLPAHIGYNLIFE